MSETNVPYGTGTGSQRSWAPGDAAGGAGADTTGVKERAAEAASRVGDAGRETARDAKERARGVAHQASDQAHGLVDRTRTELRSQVRSQQQHLAGGLRALEDELDQMAGGTQDPGYVSDLAQRAGDATGRAAQWFEDREPVDVLHEVEDFARRRPGLFIALAAGAGLLVGRFLRGAKDAPDSSGEAGSRPGVSGRAEAPMPTPAAPPAFPPTAPDGTGPQTIGGETDVERP